MRGTLNRFLSKQNSIVTPWHYIINQILRIKLRIIMQNCDFCLLTAGFPFSKHLLPKRLSLAFMWPTILDALCIWNRGVWPCVPGIVMVVHFYHPDSIMVNFCLEKNMSMHDGSSEDDPIYSKESSWKREKQSKDKDSSSGNREKGANLEIFRLHVPVEIDDKLAVLSRQWEGKTRTSYFFLSSQCCNGNDSSTYCLTLGWKRLFLENGGFIFIFWDVEEILK